MFIFWESLIFCKPSISQKWSRTSTNNKFSMTMIPKVFLLSSPIFTHVGSWIISVPNWGGTRQNQKLIAHTVVSRFLQRHWQDQRLLPSLLSPPCSRACLRLRQPLNLSWTKLSSSVVVWKNKESCANRGRAAGLCWLKRVWAIIWATKSQNPSQPFCCNPPLLLRLLQIDLDLAIIVLSSPAQSEFTFSVLPLMTNDLLG